MPSLEYFITHEVTSPEFIKLIPSSAVDPETTSHYSCLHNVDPSVPYELRESISEDPCPTLEKAEVEERIAKFVPKTVVAEEMYNVMSEELGFEKLCMIEVNHCLQAYSAVLIS